MSYAELLNVVEILARLIRRRSRFAVVITLACGTALTCSLISCGGAPSETTRPAATGPAVSIVLTSSDQAKLMAPQPQVNFSQTVASDGAAGDQNNTIIVDEGQRYQSVTGFGATFTDSSTYLLNQVATPQAREQAMNNLFTRKGTGIGLNAMRTELGSSDLSRFHFSYDDLPPGQTDPNLEHFSIDIDRVNTIPIIQQAKQLNPQMRLLASIWSPPGWMKTSGSLIGGTLLPEFYVPYTNYFVKYLQAYATEGIIINAISHENEPFFVAPDYPSMATTPQIQTLLIRDYILPALQAQHLSTGILVYDHNWDRPDFPILVLSDPVLRASGQVIGTAWHSYEGTPGTMTTLQNLFPEKQNFVTEASGGTWISDEVTTDFVMITQAMRNWSSSWLKWALALDENRGPHTGGCGSCTPLVTVNSATGAVTYTVDYYTLGHFSKFVLPGATRVYSSNATGLVSVAFANPDGSKALVVFNDTESQNLSQVLWGTQSFSYALPPKSGATFTWSGMQSGGYTVRATSRIQASSYSDVRGLQTETTSDIGGGYDLGFASGGSYALYRNIEFNTEITKVEIRVASPGDMAGNGSFVECHLDSPDGPLVATVPIRATGGFQNWETITSPATGASGIHDLYVVFKGDGAIGNLNWFSFQ